MKKNLKVCCCIIKKDLKTLILKRNSKGPRDGLWEFPGGKIEKGESELSCVIREVKEEIGLSLENINFFCILAGSNIEKKNKILFQYIKKHKLENHINLLVCLL